MALKKTLILATAMLLMPMSYSSSQETETADETVGVEEALETLVLPEIRVFSGNPLWLKGYQAFQDGDYEVAERAFTTFSNQLGPAVLLDPFITGGANGPFLVLPGGQLIVNSALVASPNINSAGVPSRITARERDSNAEVGIPAARSSYAFGSYWAGMAQIRQGDRKAAKVSMMEAIRYDRDFHEARMRVGLLNILEGKERLAKTRLRQLKRYCHSGQCGEGSDLAVYISVLEQAIETKTVDEAILLDEAS